MSFDAAGAYLDEVRRNFRGYQRLGEGALAQLRDEELFTAIDAEANSVAIIVKHMAGNMRSRWTDFLTTDGEKPDRHRDQEFEMGPGLTRAQVADGWEKGWALVFEALEPLKPDDLGRTVFIRGQEHTVLQAINRQLAHYAYHVGQIVLLAKHARGAEWKSLSIPKGQSETYGQQAELDHRRRQQP